MRLVDVMPCLAVLAAIASLGCTVPPDVRDAGVVDAGDLDAGARPDLVQVDGGFNDGAWMIEGVEQCSSNFGCRASLSSTGLRILSPALVPGEIHGEVGDGGPGRSSVSFDGGQVVLEWPTVQGRTFAAPAVGERIFIDVERFGDVEEPLRVDVYSEAGRLLVASDYNPIFRLEDDPSSPRCAYPAFSPECCCDGYRPGLVVVEADSESRLRECDEAEVRLGGLPFHVVVWGAAVALPSPCGGDGHLQHFSVGGFGLVE